MNNDPRFRDTYAAGESAAPVTPPSEPSVDPVGNAKTSYSRLGLSIVLLTIGMTVMQYVLMYLLIFLVPGVQSMWWPNWVLSLVPLYGFGLPCMLFALRREPTAPHNAKCVNGFLAYEKPPFTFKNWLLILVMGFGCMYIGSLIGNGLMSLLSALTGYSYANGLSTMIDESPTWIIIFSTCICAPLGEEFIFRKLFIDRARRWGDTTAILLSGILFGAFHGNFFQFFYAAALGVLLAYIYTRTGNIWWCVGMHAVINFMGSIVTPALAEMLPEDPMATLTPAQSIVSLLLSVWAYGMIIGGIVLLVKRRKWRVLAPGCDPRPTSRILREAILNPGMLTALILLSLTILSNLVVPVLEFYLLPQ